MVTQFDSGKHPDYVISEVDKNITGNGAQNINLFQFTGNIQILEIYGIITSINDITTCTATNFNITDTVNVVQLTTAAGTVLSGNPVNTIAVKKGLATTAITANNATQVRLMDGNSAGNDVYTPCIITGQQNNPNNFIRFGFTGDLLTNFNMKFFCKWRRLSSAANLIEA